jgi:serine/threonine protein kinase
MAVQNPSKFGQSKAAPLAVGRYQLIGRAGNGIESAYKARDPDENLVAVYLFPDEYGKSPRPDRLSAVFQTVAGLEHPNTLRVLDFGREGEFGYLVTEWVEGTTLARMIEVHSRLPEGNVIRFLAQVGQMMDHTRKDDTVPCLVSPANILVRADGVVKVIPFELLVEEAAPVAAAPVMLKGWGKPQAPTTSIPRREEPPEPKREHELGKPVPFVELIFSMGTTLHEALTGMMWVPPSTSSRRRRPPPRPVGLTERTEKAIRKTTASDPKKRPTSCAEFLKMLRGRPLTAGTPKPDARPPAAASDNRRAYVRYSLGAGTNCTINASVFDGGPPSAEIWPLVVQDVSAGVIGILLARRCEPGTELSVELMGGPDMAARSLPVTVVRVKKEQHGHWTHGCMFLTPLDDDELNALINYLGKAETV